MSVLRKIVTRVKDAVASGHEPVVVFDLDSTLFNTQPRNHAILGEFIGHPETPGHFSSIASTLGAHELGWNVVDDLKRRGFHDGEVLERLQKFWFDRFFQSHYLHHDTPLPGADAYVREVHTAGALVYYLTGRDVPNMLHGTQESLRAHKFPMDLPRVTLRLKPAFEIPDFDFKQSVLDELHTLGPVVGAFENEPVNANLFAAAFPDAEIVFLETVHSPNPPPLLPRIVRAQDFQG